MATKAKTNGAQTQVVLPEIEVRVVEIPVVGVTPLIINKFSEKAKAQIRDKQQGKAKKGREKKDPAKDYEGAFYRIETDGTPGINALAFKAAAVRAAKGVGMAMTDARAAFHIVADGYDEDGTPLVRIHSDGGPRMREDTVRVSNGGTDLRYRPEWKDWSCIVTVRYNQRLISAEQVANLLNHAGFGTGVGEWRPEKNGENGQFAVAAN